MKKKDDDNDLFNIISWNVQYSNVLIYYIKIKLVFMS